MRLLRGLTLVTVLMSFFSPFTSSAQEGEKLQVVVSFSILGDVVGQVAGEAAEVTTLIPINGDPHTFQANPQDVTTMLEADVVFINGVQFEESLTDILTSNGDINVVVASSCVPIWAFGSHNHAEEEAPAAHAEGEDHDHDESLAERCTQNWAEMETLLGGLPEYYDHTLGALYEVECTPHSDEEEDHDHAEGSCDPHVWMDPHTGILWAMLIRDTLSELDPAHAETYAANAEAYTKELSAIIQPNFALLAAIPAENRVLLTSHNTFGYLANPADFEVVEGISGIGTASEPSAAEFATLIELIAEEGVPAIFAENTVPSDLVDSLADETGVEVYRLYTDSLGDADSAAPTYIDLLNYNYQTIATALAE